MLEAFQQPSTVAGMLAKEAARHGFDGWVRLTLLFLCAVLGMGAMAGRQVAATHVWGGSGTKHPCSWAVQSDPPLCCSSLTCRWHPLPSATQVFEGWAYWHALGVTQHPQLREAALGLLRQVGRGSACCAMLCYASAGLQCLLAAV